MMDESLPGTRALATDSGTGRITAISSLGSAGRRARGRGDGSRQQGGSDAGVHSPHSYPMTWGLATQSVALDDARKAITINGAYQLRRDHEIGSPAPGEYADLVEFSADLYQVPVDQITNRVKVLGILLGGKTAGGGGGNGVLGCPSGGGGGAGHAASGDRAAWAPDRRASAAGLRGRYPYRG